MVQKHTQIYLLEKILKAWKRCKSYNCLKLTQLSTLRQSNVKLVNWPFRDWRLQELANDWSQRSLEISRAYYFGTKEHSLSVNFNFTVDKVGKTVKKSNVKSNTRNKTAADITWENLNIMLHSSLLFHKIARRALESIGNETLVCKNISKKVVHIKL